MSSADPRKEKRSQLECLLVRLKTPKPDGAESPSELTLSANAAPAVTRSDHKLNRRKAKAERAEIVNVQDDDDMDSSIEFFCDVLLCDPPVHNGKSCDVASADATASGCKVTDWNASKSIEYTVNSKLANHKTIGSRTGPDKAASAHVLDPQVNVDALPEGTVVVQPEAPSNDDDQPFIGPEITGSEYGLNLPRGADLDLEDEYKCTVCKCQLYLAEPNNIRVHPDLKVIVCKACYSFYAAGSITTDAEGYEDQCRWCGEGGTLLGCDFCPKAFCKKCIRGNFNRDLLLRIKDDNRKWKCFICDPKPLLSHVLRCSKLQDLIKKREELAKKTSREVKSAVTPRPIQKAPAGKSGEDGVSYSGILQRLATEAAGSSSSGFTAIESDEDKWISQQLNKYTLRATSSLLNIIIAQHNSMGQLLKEVKLKMDALRKAPLDQSSSVIDSAECVKNLGSELRDGMCKHMQSLFQILKSHAQKVTDSQNSKVMAKPSPSTRSQGTTAASAKTTSNAAQREFIDINELASATRSKKTASAPVTFDLCSDSEDDVKPPVLKDMKPSSPKVQYADTKASHDRLSNGSAVQAKYPASSLLVSASKQLIAQSFDSQQASFGAPPPQDVEVDGSPFVSQLDFNSGHDEDKTEDEPVDNPTALPGFHVLEDNSNTGSNKVHRADKSSSIQEREEVPRIRKRKATKPSPRNISKEFVSDSDDSNSKSASAVAELSASAVQRDAKMSGDDIGEDDDNDSINSDILLEEAGLPIPQSTSSLEALLASGKNTPDNSENLARSDNLYKKLVSQSDSDEEDNSNIYINKELNINPSKDGSTPSTSGLSRRALRRARKEEEDAKGDQHRDNKQLHSKRNNGLKSTSESRQVNGASSAEETHNVDGSSTPLDSQMKMDIDILQNSATEKRLSPEVKQSHNHAEIRRSNSDASAERHKQEQITPFRQTKPVVKGEIPSDVKRHTDNKAGEVVNPRLSASKDNILINVEPSGSASTLSSLTRPLQRVNRIPIQIASSDDEARQEIADAMSDSEKESKVLTFSALSKHQRRYMQRRINGIKISLKEKKQSKLQQLLLDLETKTIVEVDTEGKLQQRCLVHVNRIDPENGELVQKLMALEQRRKPFMPITEEDDKLDKQIRRWSKLQMMVSRKKTPGEKPHSSPRVYRKRAVTRKPAPKSRVIHSDTSLSELESDGGKQTENSEGESGSALEEDGPDILLVPDNPENEEAMLELLQNMTDSEAKESDASDLSTSDSDVFGAKKKIRNNTRTKQKRKKLHPLELKGYGEKERTGTKDHHTNSALSTEEEVEVDDQLTDIEPSSTDDVFRFKAKKRTVSSGSTSNASDGYKSKEIDKQLAERPKRRVRKKRRVKVNSSSSSSDKSVKSEQKSKADSSSDSDSDVVELNDKSTPSTPKNRRNIRRLIDEKKLNAETQNAAKLEWERRKRIKEKQKLYNEPVAEISPEKMQISELVLEKDNDNKPVVEVNKLLVKKLKPHQVDAVRFLWDCLIETVERSRKERGGGCILAHCMGLGKTLSVITFLHTLLMHEDKLALKRMLVICPLNTVLNWKAEVEKWTGDLQEDIEVDELSSCKQNANRMYKLQSWHQNGGIMIIGYDMFRNLSLGQHCKNKSLLEKFRQYLLDPGPEIVVCDEGHMLKNAKSGMRQSVMKMKTRRRVVLTGTPLQNNLDEYYCMMDFVKPNLLGTAKEFSNRFIQPIINGQFEDSTLADVKLMKKRAHVLHEMLAGCVQRKDYSALTKFLPPKHEYILSVRMSDLQIKLYQAYLDGITAIGKLAVKGKLFQDYQILSRVWSHPRLLQLHLERTDYTEASDSFLDDESLASGSTSCDDILIADSDEDAGDRTWKPIKLDKVKKVEEKPVETSTAEPPTEMDNSWWQKIASEQDLMKVALGYKFLLLFEILRKAEEIGDKVLVFSQSLLTLDLIEDFLEKIDKANKWAGGDEELKNLTGYGEWQKGKNYFRIDGQVSGQIRNRATQLFNKEGNFDARLFLISTKAGGLGINLVGANRVIIFDASWNPSHDVQAIFRAYRFGQIKPVYVYRFLAQGTMEEKIYERQIAKLSLSERVVDERQIERHFSSRDMAELYTFRPDKGETQETPLLPRDRLLADMLTTHRINIVRLHEHDSLLENQIHEELTEEERQLAWQEYQEEKERQDNPPAPPPLLARSLPQQPGGVFLNDAQRQMIYAQIRKRFPSSNPTAISQIAEEYILKINQQRFRMHQEQHQQGPLTQQSVPSVAQQQPVPQNTQQKVQNFHLQRSLQQQQQQVHAAQQQQQQRLQFHNMQQQQQRPPMQILQQQLQQPIQLVQQRQPVQISQQQKVVVMKPQEQRQPMQQQHLSAQLQQGQLQQINKLQQQQLIQQKQMQLQQQQKQQQLLQQQKQVLIEKQKQQQQLRQQSVQRQMQPSPVRPSLQPTQILQQPGLPQVPPLQRVPQLQQVAQNSHQQPTSGPPNLLRRQLGFPDP